MESSGPNQATFVDNGAPVADGAMGVGIPGMGVETPSDSRQDTTALQEAERSLSALLASPAKSATSLARASQYPGTPCAFEHVALCSDDYILTVAHVEEGGLEHRLFMAATEGLSDEEYLACIDVSSGPLGAERLD